MAKKIKRITYLFVAIFSLSILCGCAEYATDDSSVDEEEVVEEATSDMDTTKEIPQVTESPTLTEPEAKQEVRGVDDEDYADMLVYVPFNGGTKYHCNDEFDVIGEETISDTSYEDEEVYDSSQDPDAGWGTENFGVMTFDAPHKWWLEDEFYVLGSENGEGGEGYFLIIDYAEDGNIEDFLQLCRSKFEILDDVDVDFDGHESQLISYLDEYNGIEYLSIVQFIQIYSDYGTAIIEYDAPVNDETLKYLDSFYRVRESLVINTVSDTRAINNNTSEGYSDENVSSVNAGGSTSNGGTSNFNTYDNEEQQNTEDLWVLNTSRKKIHRPSCSSVKKISPKNYDTSSESIESLEARGYTKCGNCFK